MFKLYQNGVHVVGTKAVAYIPKDKVKRGKISCFSRKSSRTLRDLLSRLQTDGKMVYAVTLTLPPVKELEVNWGKLVKRYREYLRNAKLGAIWRIELQRHKIPHLHLIAVANTIEDGFEYWFAWIHACKKLRDNDGISVILHKGFLEYSVRIRYVKNRFKWMPYLIGHSVKHKIGQLGWQGRQWGVFNKDFIKFSDLDDAITRGCSLRTGQLVMRTIRRHYSKKIRQYGATGTTILNINPSIAQRLIDYYAQTIEAESPF